MAKKTNLNLDPIDFSKAKLSLDENENPSSTSIIHKIDLGMSKKDEKAALTQLSEGLAKAYDNPIIKAYLQAEKDRKTLVQASTDKWNEPSLQKK